MKLLDALIHRMGKICAVPGCRSRSTIGPKQRKSLGLRNLSLFSVPKSDDRRTEWKNLLNCELDINQFVCEFHFSEDDIKKCERTVLLDGTVYESPLVRWRLERDAVPKSDPEQPMTCEINNNDEGGIVHHDSAAAVENEQERFPIVLDETQHSPPCPPTQPWKEKVPDDAETITTTPFTVDVFKEELSAGLLPESWAWTLIPSGVVFTQLGRVDFHPQLHLEVALDLTLQVRTIADTIVRLDDRATSMRDILRHLKVLNRALICSGTGMESKSRHPRCTGMSYPDRNDNCFRTWRCETCRRLRQTLQRKNQRRGKFALRRDQAKKKAKLEQKKFKRLQRKTQEVLADVADLLARESRKMPLRRTSFLYQQHNNKPCELVSKPRR